MKLAKCPVCHCDIHLEALIEDEAGRELLGKISQLTHGCAKPIVNYLGLFKPLKSNLNNARALKLLNEVLELYPCSLLLAHVLSETVESIRKKRRDNRNLEPLTNHNYLKSVYESQRVMFAPSSNNNQTIQDRLKEDKTRSAIEYIQRYADLGQIEQVKNTPEYQIWLDYRSK
ncbi:MULTISPECIES: hypothetical protein [Pasteurellaceae]|uniref:Uncharacterized protein n=1 Tax=Pasteurella atlantica TaxID=2827233 RepID=A0AAW8CKX0_9PAST|nr:hypothetical protein [Pasteurella atlantica]MBR0573701.1 hypothetical protein [Pasteurella atlantica]MDP8039664.1 hypothetical protein [Pasteurella atlantica]MDP8041755.1 hypothetical protein [Pasteurella atlantica]MDP8043971.1 hypothetical protein [Pasteurella atlantica]MDP8045949.1 hypothetical protein [Pasteurella atlantica]